MRHRTVWRSYIRVVWHLVVVSVVVEVLLMLDANANVRVQAGVRVWQIFDKHKFRKNKGR